MARRKKSQRRNHQAYPRKAYHPGKCPCVQGDKKPKVFCLIEEFLGTTIMGFPAEPEWVYALLKSNPSFARVCGFVPGAEKGDHGEFIPGCIQRNTNNNTFARMILYISLCLNATQYYLDAQKKLCRMVFPCVQQDTRWSIRGLRYEHEKNIDVARIWGTLQGRFFEGGKNTKYLICKDIKNEADGTRTRNIQIDSLVL